MEWKDKPINKKYADIQQTLKLIDYYLALYTFPQGQKPVVPFQQVEDMAKFFKMMIDPLIE